MTVLAGFGSAVVDLVLGVPHYSLVPAEWAHRPLQVVTPADQLAPHLVSEARLQMHLAAITHNITGGLGRAGVDEPGRVPGFLQVHAEVY